MAKFKLNNNLAKNIADSVNKVNAKADFGIRNIDINLLVPSEKNFYEISDIEELAESIEQNGLYHNLIVRKLDDEERYEILSGERRYEALKMLYESGNENFSKVPCQVRNNVDDTDAEIILIQANAETRELSEMEKIKQIQRLEELYKIKKSKGEKIPGKLRDKIGQHMNLSGVQVQRYKKIGKDLIPELKEMLEIKRIGMADAFKFSGLEENKQKAIYEFLKVNDGVSASEANNKVNKDNIELKEKVNNLDDNIENDSNKSISNNLVDISSESASGNLSNKNESKSKNENVQAFHGDNKSSDGGILEIIKKTSKNLNSIKDSFQTIDKNELIQFEKDIKLFLENLNKYLFR